MVMDNEELGELLLENTKKKGQAQKSAGLAVPLVLFF